MIRKPIMIMSGEFWPGASGAGLADGFRQHGWIVEEIDFGRFAGNVGRSLPARAGQRLAFPLACETFRKTILEKCETLRPDVFLTIKGTQIDAALLHRLKALGCRLANFYPDFHFDHSGVDHEDFQLYDLFVTTKSFHLDWLRQRLPAERIAFVHHGYSPHVHLPLHQSMEERDFLCDILYVGNRSPYKQQWLAPVAERFANNALSIVGYGWGGVDGASPLSSAVLGTALVGLAYAQAMQTARINIALHSGPDQNGWADLVSTRTFEIPAAKGFMLHIDNEEIRALFEVGREIDVFATPDELMDKIAYYLPRPDLRREMAERAFARCVPAYSYTQRAGEITERLRASPPPGGDNSVVA